MILLIAGCPAAIKLGLTLVSVVLLMRLKVPLGVALLVGSVFLALMFPMAPVDFFAAGLAGIISDECILLLIIVVGILVFSGALNAVGQIDRIINAFKAMVGESRLSLVAFPALIGLLPMPGGAIFSAPMVGAAAKNANVPPEKLTAANYWYRHIWEYWFPFYPGVIMALTLTEVATWKFALMQLPLTILAVISGYMVILHGISLGGERHRDYSLKNIFAFLRELIPILIVVGAVLLLDPLAEFMTERFQIENMVLRRAPIVFGLLLGTIWLFTHRDLTWTTLGQLAKKKNVLEMCFLAIGVMVFKSVLDDCGAVTFLRDEFEAWNVPLVVVVSALPMISGLVLGIAIGFVGASFPLVIALLEELPTSERLPYYCLAFTSGFAGMMMSPVHFCLVLTNEYFKSSLMKVYKYLIPLGLITAAAGLALFFLYTRV
ncbi:DUF401 family protein [Candidatus Hydrogenedentota bacterium]